MYGGVDVQIHIFLTSVLTWVERSASRLGCSTSGERAPSTHGIGGWTYFVFAVIIRNKDKKKICHNLNLLLLTGASIILITHRPTTTVNPALIEWYDDRKLITMCTLRQYSGIFLEGLGQIMTISGPKPESETLLVLSTNTNH
jgi:hypothetical protein